MGILSLRSKSIVVYQRVTPSEGTAAAVIDPTGAAVLARVTEAAAVDFSSQLSQTSRFSRSFSQRSYKLQFQMSQDPFACHEMRCKQLWFCKLPRPRSGTAQDMPGDFGVAGAMFNGSIAIVRMYNVYCI